VVSASFSVRRVVMCDCRGTRPAAILSKLLAGDEVEQL
jgi:hypothetical protein